LYDLQWNKLQTIHDCWDVTLGR